jgi:hypothetical protein
MSNINTLFFCLVAIYCTSCRQQDRDTKEEASSNHRTNGQTPVCSDATIIQSNPPADRPTSTEVVATEQRIDNAKPNRSSKGGIVASRSLMSSGDEYLLGIKKGLWRHTIPELSQKDLVGVDLAAILAGARPLKSSNAEIKISDPVTAYARVLDLGISMTTELRCIGIFTDENEDTYFVFYGIDGKPVSRFSNVFSVNKNDGNVTMR